MIPQNLSLGDIPLHQVNLSFVSRRLTDGLKDFKKEHAQAAYFAVIKGNELTSEMQFVAHCGLQLDIRKRISEGMLSYNKAWTDVVLAAETITVILDKASSTVSRLYRQLKAAFGTHPVDVFCVSVVKADKHDAIIFLEAYPSSPVSYLFFDEPKEQLVAYAEKIFLSILKDSVTKTKTDWEKAVHELASPLDFIYSNSDFLKFYLVKAEVSDEAKIKKLDDFKIIAQLLINRLHQFRFSFAGVKNIRMNPSQVSVYETFMPICHLWYHESTRKRIKFLYDDLKPCPQVFIDKELLQFIIFNLVSNAIKYSYRDTYIHFYASERKGDMVAIGVKNQGIPIVGEDRFKIFDDGFRTEEARKFDARGMGIGLGVCRQLATVLGGGITLVDNTDGWNVFELVVPRVARS